MKLVYFAWVRERIGKAEEHLEPPGDIATVAGLLEWLKSRGDGYAEALKHSGAIRVAIDHEHASHTDSIGGAGEIALFPPMTGG